MWATIARHASHREKTDMFLINFLIIPYSVETNISANIEIKSIHVFDGGISQLLTRIFVIILVRLV